MTVVERGNAGLLAHLKGAPEVVLSRCTEFLSGTQIRPLTAEVRDQVTAAQTRMASAGLRTLAIARHELPIGTAMDADQIGLAAEVAITGGELDQMTDHELVEHLKKEVVFARTTPQHKLRIVNATGRWPDRRDDG